jgi:hypothetical protein
MSNEHYDSKEDLAGYFDLMDELGAVHKKFFAQPWVKAVRASREADNWAHVPVEGRTYPVTQAQYIMARKFFSQLRNDNVRLLGYALIPGDN